MRKLLAAAGIAFALSAAPALAAPLNAPCTQSSPSATRCDPVNVNNPLPVSGIDACQGATTTTPINISTAATSVIVPGTAAKNTYICGMMLLSGGTTNVGVVQGSGVTCGTSTLGLIGGATAAAGLILTAQAGFVSPPTGYRIAGTTVAANDICLINGSAIQVSGYIVTAVR